MRKLSKLDRVFYRGKLAGLDMSLHVSADVIKANIAELKELLKDSDQQVT